MIAVVVPALLSYGFVGLSSGLLAGPSRVRRALSLGLATLALGLPLWVAPEHTLLRALLALGGLLLVFRAVDLAREPRELPHGLRVGLMFALLDLRQIAAQPKVVELRRLALGLALAGLTAAGFGLALAEGGGHLVRWLSGAVGVYAMAECANQLTLFGWHAAGYRIPPQHRAPILATSVTDFWSRRWNLNVRDWLHRNLYRPLAASGHPVLGVVAAFSASALLHFWFIAVALGLGWGLVMASFFVIQGLFVLLEARLRLRRSPGRRIWTIVALFATSPLFVEPFLRLLG